MQSDLENIIGILESSLKDPSKGLPEEIFLFISSVTPMVNVDLLIKNKKDQTLLTWRDEDSYQTGWHVPGGIIRFKETAESRIEAVALNELGATVEFKKVPLAVNEIILPEMKRRAHFISFLYECSLNSPLNQKLKYEQGNPKPGEWMWHDKCPENIINVHDNIYRSFI